jgi:hypothetical protein
MTLLKIFIFVWIFSLSAVSLAETNGDSWYFLGDYKFFVSPTYTGDVSRTLSDLNASDHKYLGFDYGVYWKVKEIYIGPGIVMFSDKYSRNQISAADQIAVGILGVSVLYPFTGDPANGFFLRGDLGFCVINRPGNYLNGNLIEINAKVATEGWGGQLSGAYGFMLNEKVSLFPFLGYGYARETRGDSYSFFSAGAGIML